MADGEMRYGVILPGGSAPEQLEQAVLAERAGWDGVFVWEAAYGVDAWSRCGTAEASTRGSTITSAAGASTWPRRSGAGPHSSVGRRGVAAAEVDAPGAAL